VTKHGGGRIGKFAFDDVEVAMADAAGRHLDQNFSLARFRLWYILYNQRTTNALEDGSLHTRASCGMLVGPAKTGGGFGRDETKGSAAMYHAGTRAVSVDS
jgi:hypothetical protein